MSKGVLDASAILALINEEPGSDIVLKHLPGAVVSSVNLSEVATVLTKIGMSKNEIKDTLSSLISEVIDFDGEQAYDAADLYMSTHQHGLSLGDRACISLAQQKKLSVITADKVWAKAKLPVKVTLIR